MNQNDELQAIRQVLDRAGCTRGSLVDGVRRLVGERDRARAEATKMLRALKERATQDDAEKKRDPADRIDPRWAWLQLPKKPAGAVRILFDFLYWDRPNKVERLEKYMREASEHCRMLPRRMRKPWDARQAEVNG